MGGVEWARAAHCDKRQSGNGCGWVLRDNSLTGTMPTEMEALTQLTYLSISNNNLAGTVPTEIAHTYLLVSVMLSWE
ncbi:hypothetical protein CYMTET_43547 [Cymbomonas tetramitiformis]|uniref:Uncharacterized protein n=1 Tax=Cymbomonas tetramitiformis TaxID=36881 RepID=A0AAE0C382_9CHLO|nr:hypothetical protein CYMTET_43547 [Cymbomonas tetramitiformis]